MPTWSFVASWPDKRLSPNARVHWRAKANAAKAQRQEGRILAKSVNAKPSGKVTVKMTFCPKTNRRRDLDNLIAATKSLRDGISDAIGIDDSKTEISAVIGPIAPEMAFVAVEILAEQALEAVGVTHA